MSLSFVKEGDDSAAVDVASTSSSAAPTVKDTRPLAVILQANREAKQAEYEAKLKAKDQQLTVTDDDLAFMATREQAHAERLAAIERAERAALAEFRSAVADRVVVAVPTTPTPPIASTEKPAAETKNPAAVVDPPVPTEKRPLVGAALLQPAMHVVKKARKADVDPKPKAAAASTGLSFLGQYDSDSEST